MLTKEMSNTVNVTCQNIFSNKPLVVITNNCTLNRFQQKDIETLQKIAILLLKVLHDEDFDHELQQMC